MSTTCLTQTQSVCRFKNAKQERPSRDMPTTAKQNRTENAIRCLASPPATRQMSLSLSGANVPMTICSQVNFCSFVLWTKAFQTKEGSSGLNRLKQPLNLPKTPKHIHTLRHLRTTRETLQSSLPLLFLTHLRRLSKAVFQRQWDGEDNECTGGLQDLVEEGNPLADAA